jgi:hypothetical protein
MKSKACDCPFTKPVIAPYTKPVTKTANKVDERFYRNHKNLFESLTGFCQQTLEKACVQNGNASFMVSGGCH